HDHITGFEGGEVTSLLCETASKRGRNGVGQSHCGSEHKVLKFVKAESLLREKVEVVKIQRGREGVDSFEQVNGRGLFARKHSRLGRNLLDGFPAIPFHGIAHGRLKGVELFAREPADIVMFRCREREGAGLWPRD